MELFIKSCENLKKIHLTTGADYKQTEQQQQQLRLNTVAKSVKTFKDKGMQLIINYSDSLHDREIR